MQQDFLRRQETACLVHIQEWWITLRQTKTSFVSFWTKFRSY
jgi:hypothetical protein